MDNYYTHQFDTNIEKRVISEWDTYETAITKNGNLGMEGLRSDRQCGKPEYGRTCGGTRQICSGQY